MTKTGRNDSNILYNSKHSLHQTVRYDEQKHNLIGKKYLRYSKWKKRQNIMFVQFPH